MPRGVLLPPGVGLPPFLVELGEGGRKGIGGEGKRGPAPLALNQFGLGFGGGGGGPTLPLLPSISTKAHVGPLSPEGGGFR